MADRIPDSETQGLLAAERALIGAALLGEPATLRACVHVAPDAFYRVAHQEVWRSILALCADGQPPSRITVLNDLEARGRLDRVGGVAYLAELEAHGSTLSDTAALARIVLSHHARRTARKIGLEIVEGSSNGRPLADIARSASERLARAVVLEGGAAPERIPSLDEQILTDQQLVTLDEPAPESLVGQQLIIAGGLTILAGHSGLGKTWLALQLMRAMARGEPWLGFDVARGASLLVELEMPRGGILERVQKGAAPAPDQSGHQHFLVQPRGFGDFSRPETIDALSIAIERRRVRLMCVDSLNKVMPGNRNDEEIVERGLTGCMTLSQRTGVSVLLIHHFNKTDLSKADLKDQVLLGLRGSARLQNDPDTILGLMRHHGRVVLVPAKTRYAPDVGNAIVTVKQREDGWFDAVAGEAEIIDENARKIEKALTFGEGGKTMDDLLRLTGMRSHNTVLKYLRQMGAVDIKDGRIVRWYPSDAMRAQEGF